MDMPPFALAWKLTYQVELLKKLQHEHIVQLLDVHEANETYIMVMEKLDGGELFDRIVKRKTYTEQVSKPREAARWWRGRMERAY